MKLSFSSLSYLNMHKMLTDFTYLKLSNCKTCRRVLEILSTQPPIRLDPTVICSYTIHSIYCTYTVSSFTPDTSFTSFCFFFFKTCKNFEIGTYWKHLCSLALNKYSAGFTAATCSLKYSLLFAGGERRLLLPGANVIWLHWHQFVTIWCWWFEMSKSSTSQWCFCKCGCKICQSRTWWRNKVQFLL